jgi:hypothetical protein
MAFSSRLSFASKVTRSASGLHQVREPISAVHTASVRSIDRSPEQEGG